MHAFDWTVEKSDYVIKDNWIALRADTCKMPNGRVVAPYYVLEYPTWVNVVAVTENNDVVLVRQYRHGLRKTVLELPCGSVEARDTSPLDAIKRELLEETGYTGDYFVETGKISPNPANHSNFTHCFLATPVEQVQQPNPDDTEQIETVLVPLKDIIKLIENGELYQALHVVSLFRSFQKLGKLQFI